MKYNKFILPLAACAFMFAGCVDEVMEWQEPDGTITEADIPLQDKESLALYKSIKEYAAEYTPDMKIGLGLGADLYIEDAAYRAVADENFQMFTTGNAMKHSSVVKANGDLNFATIDAFMALVPSDVEVYGHNFIWHTQQKQQYLKSLISPEMKVEVPQGEKCENVVTNGGFENGTEGWTGLWGKYAYAVEQPGHESDNAIHFTISPECANQWDAQLFWSLDSYLEPGVTYYYEFYAKSDSGLGCQFIGQNASYDGIYKDQFTPGTDWTFCSGEFTHGEDDLADIERVGLQFGGEPGSQIWFDDFKFGKKLENTEPEKIINVVGPDGQFEWTDGTTGQWTGLWGKYSYAVATPGYEGNQAMEFTLTAECANQWDAQLFWPVELEVGKTYAYSFWAKSDSGLNVQFIGQNEAYSGIYKDAFDLPSDWFFCEGEFTYTESDPEAICRVGVQFGAADSEGAKFWIDEFKFGEKIPAPAARMATPRPQKAAPTITYIYKTAEEKKALLLGAMESWIKQMAEHLPTVKYWDVINEPIMDGSNAWRGIDNVFNGEDTAPVENEGLTLNWAADHWYWGYYIGKDYAPKAFEYARQYCGPDAKLFVNDYNLETSPGKLQALIDFVKYIDENNSTGASLVDGIGTQMHVQTSITKDKVDAMFKAMAATGKLVRVTELDVAVGTANPTADQLLAQAETYKMIVESYKENVPAAQQSGITIWTLSDNAAEHEFWLEGDAPNLFDANYGRKLAYKYFCDGLAGKNIADEFDGLDWKDVYATEEETPEETPEDSVEETPAE